MSLGPIQSATTLALKPTLEVFWGWGRGCELGQGGFYSLKEVNSEKFCKSWKITQHRENRRGLSWLTGPPRVSSPPNPSLLLLTGQNEEDARHEGQDGPLRADVANVADDEGGEHQEETDHGEGGGCAHCLCRMDGDGGTR